MPLFKRERKRTLKEDIQGIRASTTLPEKIQLLDDLLFSWMPNYSKGLVNQKLQIMKSFKRDGFPEERNEEIENGVEEILKNIEENNQMIEEPTEE
ncbi:MAG: hypothetical protein KAR35_01660 [Candidatus Heimdallarchaeota archaeon]|nr:hypothetical protein [Candidatus Heimdallarchaeota archaeon]MCK5048061.1 hypothetical protein [Candidatus Heimdallarchaeota archaeon]